jgi:hypothetical protein
MRLPRVRITLRRLMIAVAVFALALGYGLDWFRRANKSHMRVRLSAEPLWPETPAGQRVPISIDYGFGLDLEGDAPPGMPLLVQSRLLIVDTATGAVIDRCDFDQLLVAGIRDNTTDTFVWWAKNHGPGRYRVKRWLRAWQPIGAKKLWSGGGSKAYRVLPDPPEPR